MPKTLFEVVCIYLERQDVDIMLNALRYAVEDTEDEISKCNDPDLIEKLQKNIDDINRVMKLINEQLN